jgi:hypothetical protein
MDLGVLPSRHSAEKLGAYHTDLAVKVGSHG